MLLAFFLYLCQDWSQAESGGILESQGCYGASVFGSGIPRAEWA